MKLAVLSILTMVAFTLPPPGPAIAQGTTIVVDDAGDAFPDGGCNGVTPSGCTLREAIMAANLTEALDTITFDIGDPAVITLSVPDSGEDEPDAFDGDLDIIRSLRIDAGGQDITVSALGIQDGNGPDRVVQVHGVDGLSVDVEIVGLTLRDGFVSPIDVGQGGGLWAGFETLPSGGDLAVILDDVTIASNIAAPPPSGTSAGGGVYARGVALSIIDSTVAGNVAVDGGGIAAFGMGLPGESVTVSRTTIAGNTATASGNVPLGGGLYMDNLSGELDQTLLRDNGAASTVVTVNNVDYGGVVPGLGGAIAILGDGMGSPRLGITDSLIRDSTAVSGGGGVLAEYADIDVARSAIVNNAVTDAQNGTAPYVDGGGALSLLGPTHSTIINSTISGNTAAFGGAILQETPAAVGDATSEVTVRFSTIVDNGPGIAPAGPGSGAIQLEAEGAGDMAALHVRGSILESPEGVDTCADNTPFIGDGVLTLGGNSDDDESCGLTETNPSLPDDAGFPQSYGALADNGGPAIGDPTPPGGTERAPSHLLTAGSQSVDRIFSSCDALTVDQRSQPRPLDGDGDGTAECDRGAVELPAVAEPPVTPPVTPTSADLVLTKTGPETVTEGEPIRFVLTVRNTGGQANAVTVTDTLPADLTLVSSPDGCAASGSTVTCAVGTLETSASRTIELVTSAAGPGAYTNRACAATTSTEANPANDCDDHEVEVTPGTDLYVTVLDDTLTDGVCTPGRTSTDCTLRDAVNLNNTATLAQPVRILLADAQHQLVRTGLGEGEESALDEDLDVHRPLEVIGMGTNDEVGVVGQASSSDGFRMWEIHPTAGTVAFRNVSFRDGYAQSGGLIAALDSPTLDLVLDRFSLAGGNAVASPTSSAPTNEGLGGGLYVANSAGEGVFDVRLRNGTINDNRASTAGGGLAVVGDGSLLLSDVRVSDNGAYLGGGIFASGDFLAGESELTPTSHTLERVTLTNNQSGLGGAGLTSVRATLTLRETNVTNNQTGVEAFIAGFTGNSGAAGFAALAIRGALTVAGGGGPLGFLQAGNSPDSGGGGIVVAEGSATLRSSTVSGNESGVGGGFLSVSLAFAQVIDQELPGGGPTAVVPNVISIDRSLIANNSGELSAGGMVHGEGSLTVTNSTFQGNAGNVAGGLMNGLEVFPQTDGVQASATATIDTSTFTGNIATLNSDAVNTAAGGLYTSGDMLDVRDTTFANNRATGRGFDSLADAMFLDGPALVTRTLLAGDGSSSNGACASSGSGSVDSTGGSIDPDDSCGFDHPDDRPGTTVTVGDPEAIPLSRGLALAILPPNPAIDVSDGCGAVDIRGIPRPIDGDVDGVARCDAGAFEYSPVIRLAGPTRIETAVAISQALFPDTTAAGAARPGAVLLSRADGFADALAGTPLGHDRRGVILLTETQSLNAVTAAEINRIATSDTPIILLGGVAAISDDVADDLRDRGFTNVQRVGGANRFATAVEIAGLLGDPDAAVVADGGDFTSPLVAAVAATTIDGALLLTSGPDLPPETAAYLDRVSPSVEAAVGDVAILARPTAEPIAGATPGQVSVAASARFMPGATVFGLATSERFPDALTGGVFMARAGGPMLLSPGAALDPDVDAHLRAGAFNAGVVFGGTAAISDLTFIETVTAIGAASTG